jgi:hypothetical protein
MKSFVLPQVARFWRPSDILPVTFQSLNLSDKHFRMLGLPPKNIKACAQVLPETCRDETAYETTKMTQTRGNNGIIMKSKVIKRSATVWKDQIRESWAQDHCKASSIRWLHRLWIEVTKDLAMTLELLSRLSGLSLQSTLSQGLWNVYRFGKIWTLVPLPCMPKILVSKQPIECIYLEKIWENGKSTSRKCPEEVNPDLRRSVDHEIHEESVKKSSPWRSVKIEEATGRS